MMTINIVAVDTIIRWSHSSTSDFAYSYTFLRSVVCRLSHLCCVLKSFDRCHLAGTLVGSNDTLCLMGSLTPREGEIWGSNPQPKHAIANCCRHLANKNEERFRLSPNYFGAYYYRLLYRIISWRRLVTTVRNNWPPTLLSRCTLTSRQFQGQRFSARLNSLLFL